ncbi:hypothetical protein L1049_007182 [Liquidambar formosana]|uniref:TPX2 C-terminal domain-containing protein n=1 Tax=Liquidambar formosana TaxID=63359 RepID=A0AAP0RK76_LIQFO
MAGEIEEPFSFNFQADTLHSGSISFGRFESESLSWERRSSFSHNRYLEEVEKCSKPGSVIEKKAYFEAHFKKKALLRQSSSECQNGTEYQTSKNDISENMGYREEFENVDEGRHFAHFDESPGSSDYHGECELMEYDREDTGISYSEPQMEPAFNSADVSVEDDLKYVELEETHQIEAGCDKLHVDNAEEEIEVKENLKDERGNEDEVTKAIDSSPKGRTAGKNVSTSFEHWRNPSPKLRGATEAKLIKPRSKSRVNVSQAQRNISSVASKDSAKIPSRRERESLQGTKIDKRSLQTANPTAQSIRRTPRPEGSESLKAKLNHENKCSEKELRAKKEIEPHPSALMKVGSRAQQTSNRPNRTVNSSKPDMKSSPAGFNFKCEERAERRKEFYMKIEEKMHAKEAEMNQIQARTQEKTEAEIKQFRRSLNFKATPMPSFYHGAVQPGSDKNKAVSSSTKSTKLQSKSLCPGSRAAAGSRSYPKAGNDQVVSPNESVNTSDSPQASGATSCLVSEPSEASVISVASLTHRNRSSQAGMKSEVAGKKERGREKDTNLQKHRVSEVGKVTKGQRVGVKNKVGARSSSNEMVRKHMKGIGIGSGSGMGHQAVGVAS